MITHTWRQHKIQVIYDVCLDSRPTFLFITSFKRSIYIASVFQKHDSSYILSDSTLRPLTFHTESPVKKKQKNGGMSSLAIFAIIIILSAEYIPKKKSLTLISWGHEFLISTQAPPSNSLTGIHESHRMWKIEVSTFYPVKKNGGLFMIPKSLFPLKVRHFHQSMYGNLYNYQSSGIHVYNGNIYLLPVSNIGNYQHSISST